MANVSLFGTEMDPRRRQQEQPIFSQMPQAQMSRRTSGMDTLQQIQMLRQFMSKGAPGGGGLMQLLAKLRGNAAGGSTAGSVGP